MSQGCGTSSSSHAGRAVQARLAHPKGRPCTGGKSREHVSNAQSTERRAASAARHGCGRTYSTLERRPGLDIALYIFKYIYALPPSELQALKADLFRALGHPARIRILELLSARAHTVQELQDALELDQPAVSQHLAALRA